MPIVLGRPGEISDRQPVHPAAVCRLVAGVQHGGAIGGEDRAALQGEPLTRRTVGGPEYFVVDGFGVHDADRAPIVMARMAAISGVAVYSGWLTTAGTTWQRSQPARCWALTEASKL